MRMVLSMVVCVYLCLQLPLLEEPTFCLDSFCPSYAYSSATGVCLGPSAAGNATAEVRLNQDSKGSFLNHNVAAYIS